MRPRASRSAGSEWNLRGATSGTHLISAFGSGDPPPSLDAVTAFTSFIRRNLLPLCCPESIRFRSIQSVFHMILALKLRLGFLQYSLFPISSDHCAGDGVCWKLCKSARQRMSFSAADSYLVFCAVGPPLCLCAIASTTLGPPSRDPRMTISGGPFPRFPAYGSDFRCRTSGSFLDCQVSHEFNFQRQRASCGPSSVSRSTLKRSGVIGCLCKSRSSFVSTPS